MNTYRLCRLALKNGLLTMEKLDAFLARGRLTAEQYGELAEEIPVKENAPGAVDR